ncbi:E3 ubiquitin-protein ligase TRIM41-like [Hemicordylus capensis]|uniref:E3 ubiquitin-protein ligase TRIM41-like n=1 Tax=Hemicordylus capensis TaxID=884348 RepID=UPI002303725A|nr:E3 ubiquitin-protein ligase TRIM41-like [Hemicordylus capensis]
MAASTPRKRLRDEMTCPICLDFFTEPVILKCGQNFCRACLVNHWVALPGNNNTCPHCTERVQQKDLKPNRQLANVVEIVKEFWVEGKQEAVKWTVCERHQEPQKHFCKEDGAPICAVCKHSEEHQTHNVVPVEEAAQEYKIQINRRLNILKKERLKMVESEAERERENEDLLKQTKAEKEKTVAEFGQLHLFLEEQEQLFLAKMEEVEKEIARRRAEHINRVREELSSLTSSIQEMEKMSQQSPGELLQNIGSTLQRCEEELPTSSVAFPLELKWSIVDICDIHSFLEGIMKEFKENLSSGLQLQKGVWAVGKLRGAGWFSSDFDSPPLLSAKIKRIHVSLNYDAGRVAFYDADSGASLFVFSGASFCGETLLPLFMVDPLEPNLQEQVTALIQPCLQEVQAEIAAFGDGAPPL